jgi:cell fate (sporulation/competence/biofilm development) regulator YmcA (YheA/YmcA/DUF963 family)
VKNLSVRSLKMLLLSLCVVSLNLSATFWQVPEDSVHNSYRLGHLQVLHDDEDGWLVIDNDGCSIQVEDCNVDQNIRYIENEDLLKVLGPCYFELTGTDLETGETVAHYEVHAQGYIVVGIDEDGEYVIRFYMRGPGGGKILGFLVGAGVKIVGYTVISVAFGPVGLAAVGWGLAATAVTTATSFGIDKGVKALDTVSKMKNLHKAMKAAQKAEEAVEKYKKAGKTVENLKRLKDATEALNKARNLVTNLNGVKALGKAVEGASKINDAAGAAQSGIAAGKAGLEASKLAAKTAGKALINPLVAGLDAVADLAQLGAEWLPWL